MILSLIVYTGTGAIMAWLGWHVGRREQRVMQAGGSELPFASWEILAAMFIYVVVASFRWLTSWDYNMYYSYYISMQSLGEFSRKNFEPGFALITGVMARAGCHFALYFAFWAITQVLLLYYAFRHRKVLLPWLALCVFLGPYFIFWMGFVRQSVVEALFVLMVELIVRRRFWYYLLLSAVAISLHRMCVLFIPLYFIPLIRVPGGDRFKRWLPLALIVLCFVLGSFPQWIKWSFDRIGSLADLLGYGHYYRLFVSNNMEYTFRPVMGPARMCPLLTCVMIIWYWPAIRNMFATDRYLPALFRFAVVYMGYINLFANTTQYLTRPGELMRSVFLVMTCFLLQYLWKQRRWIPFAIAAFFNFYYVYYEIAKYALYGGSIYVPELYHTFLF